MNSGWTSLGSLLKTALWMYMCSLKLENLKIECWVSVCNVWLRGTLWIIFILLTAVSTPAGNCSDGDLRLPLWTMDISQWTVYYWYTSFWRAKCYYKMTLPPRGGTRECISEATSLWEHNSEVLWSSKLSNSASICYYNYRISANRRRGVYLFRWSVWCGDYSRAAFILLGNMTRAAYPGSAHSTSRSSVNKQVKPFEKVWLLQKPVEK